MLFFISKGSWYIPVQKCQIVNQAFDTCSVDTDIIFDLDVSFGLRYVTGGWVMNDEANTHYFAMIDQMIEGMTTQSKHIASKYPPKIRLSNTHFIHLDKQSLFVGIRMHLL